ncbi:DUF1127 domain-containing protein [Pseudorhodobacter sp.]|uniref:DUF1127 domain-containing protein n=1 Tax=Pseudorhodobacter sp. TaxID=1934400 RepID=UPI002649EC24|nr:DUF1127 domain-containing protein [Pseudorhodobacter sp.]MDN5786592.1 DUF1127 domain-containing protein [Pseudorhodobacter sp.]
MSIHLINQPNATSIQQEPSNDDVGRFHRWLLAATREWQRNRTNAVLKGLDDRTLADIGIQRSDIPDLAASLATHALAMSPAAKAMRVEDVKKGAYLEAA